MSSVALTPGMAALVLFGVFFALLVVRVPVAFALGLLAASAVVFNRTSSQGYNLVLAPEGVSAISVSYWAFLGPALLWLGAALLTSELSLAALRRGRHGVGQPITTRESMTLAGEIEDIEFFGGVSADGA